MQFKLKFHSFPIKERKCVFMQVLCARGYIPPLFLSLFNWHTGHLLLLLEPPFTNFLFFIRCLSFLILLEILIFLTREGVLSK
jgi:hypothetical protein